MSSRSKKKWKTFLIYIAVLYTAFMLCDGLFYIVDVRYNGVVREWLADNFIESRNVVVSNEMTGKVESLVMKEPAWHSLKELLFLVACAGVFCWVTSIFVVSRFYAQRKVKEKNTAINRLFQAYMIDGENVIQGLSEEDTELFARMTEVKSTMQRHEQMLKEEAARKNDLIVYLAHDLKTPLTSVVGYLSLMQEVPEMPAEQKAKYINITLDKALHLEKLINEFFEITRYNLQQIILEKEQIDLYYMLVQMTDEFYPILAAHGNTIRLHAEEDLVVYGDSEKLARVFNNILKNAVAYSYPDTEIEIMAENKNRGVDIYFINKGKTIPRNKLESIFEKFFRLDESRSTNTGGAGLGLAIAKEIVTLHGGQITADSENERTTFHVSLPV